jgi:malonyl-CoA decarboxylase
MQDNQSRSLFRKSLRKLRKLWREVPAPGWLRADRELSPSLSDTDLDLVREQMRECLAAKGGEVSARLRAAELGNGYLQLSEEGRERFLTLLADEFRVDRESVDEAIAGFQQADPGDTAAAEEALRASLRSPRLRLLTQFNDLPEGTKFLVDMRRDLLRIAGRGGELRAFDGEFQRLLASWFDPGFLELRRIDWDSQASLLEKLIDYEAVHEIGSWVDLRNRLETDRCCYAFFHHHMPGEPLIFVEVALVNGIAGNIQVLLDEAAPELDPGSADTAIFYSISNTQKGLRGISFGNFLIKRVVDDLCSRFPGLNQFVTLSPIPGFGRWLAGLTDEEYRAAASPENRAALAEAAGSEDPAVLQSFLAGSSWSEEEQLAGRLEKPLLALCAHYLARAKRGVKPRDPVARFHLGNGARIERLNWLGNRSAVGLTQSAGLMVNYAYRLGEMEKNHEGFAAGGEIALSPELKRLLKK